MELTSETLKLPVYINHINVTPNKKRSLLRLTRPTVFWSADRTLFFDFASDTFWRRSVRGQLRRRSRSRERSRKVKIKQRAYGRRSWLLTQAFEPRSRCVKRCATLLNRCNAISVGCSKSCITFAFFLRLPASTSKLTYRSFLFFWPIRSRPANQLFLVYGEASGSICQVPCGQEPFCRGRLLHVDEDATLLSVLRVALGDNESLNSTLRTLAPETRRSTSRRRPAQCLSSHHRGTRSSEARSKEARDSGLELVTSTWSTVQHTRAAWATLATTFFW